MSAGYSRPRRACRLLIPALILLAVLATLCLPRAVGAAASLSLTPARVSCTGRVTVQGAGLTPGQTVALTARATTPPSGNGLQFATPTVADDGTFRLDLTVSAIMPACLTATPPMAGTAYTIYLTTDSSGRAENALLATAVLTLDTAATPGLPNTGAGGERTLARAGNVGLILLALGALGGVALRSRYRALNSRDA